MPLAIKSLAKKVGKGAATKQVYIYETWARWVARGIQFILAIIVVEPWKRRRLAQTFEKKVEEMSAETISAFESRQEALAQQVEQQNNALMHLVEAVAYSLQPAAVPPAHKIGSGSLPTQDAVAVFKPMDVFGLSRQQTIALVASSSAAGLIGWAFGAWL